MTKVIACAHEKGGVGKTTTTVNLGFGLARQGKNVLLLDADPQGDLTKCLGIKNPRELTSTISSVMDYLIAHSDEDAYPDFEYTAPSDRTPKAWTSFPPTPALRLRRSRL
jgi:chromosome partitioning protein